MITTKIAKENIDVCVKSFTNAILQEDCVDNLRKACRSGKINEMKIRALAWRLFLNVLDESEGIDTWITTLYTTRQDYKKLVHKYLTVQKLSGDPLSMGGPGISSTQNWSSHFQDSEVQKLIKLDIARTYQEIDIFNNDNIKKLMHNILFIWAKVNSDVGYKQGMNELLAVILLAFYPFYFKNDKKLKKEEILNLINDEESFRNNAKTLFLVFNDESELESDLYYTFSNLMKFNIKALYDTKLAEKKIDFKKTDLTRNKWSQSNEDDAPTPLNNRILKIITEKLKLLDVDIYNHFNQIGLNCSIFLQRWLKCIFNREFEYHEVYPLWDAIFAEEEDPNNRILIFIDYICLAMVLRIRNDLIHEEQNECFMMLFKYPKIDDTFELVKIAENIKFGLAEKAKNKVIPIEYLLKGFPKDFEKRGNSKFSMSNFLLASKEKNNNNEQQAFSGNRNLEENDEDESRGQNKMGMLISGMKNRVGGILSGIKNKIKGDDNDISSDNYNPINIQSKQEAFDILENILTKYSSKMQRQDLHEFGSAIDFLKNNQ